MVEMTRSFFAGPRVRLMLSYVLFFTLLLAALGLLFRQVLKRQFEGEVQALLDNDWGAIKGWVSIKNERPVWEKPNDEDEQTIVARLKQNRISAASRAGWVRMSPHFYQTEQEIDQGIDALA